MSDITVKFISNFKSFKLEDLFELKGDLIAITGENGSGKSQLLSSAGSKQITPNSPHQPIDVTEVTIDGIEPRYE